MDPAPGTKSPAAFAERTGPRINTMAELSEQPAQGKPEAVDRIAEIEQLATLDPLEYELTRRHAAEQLNLRASFLDREVAEKRRTLGLTTHDDNGQGRPVKIA